MLQPLKDDDEAVSMELDPNGQIGVRPGFLGEVGDKGPEKAFSDGKDTTQ